MAEGYGLTEVTMVATMGPIARSGVRKVGTVGLPVFDTEVRIVDPARDDLTPLPTGEHGEVCIRGPQVMVGYKDRPEETAAALVDGWLRTGDVGVLDEDGYLAIVDRKKDMLLYKGYNVFPRELEELLFARPGVVGAAVVGRPDPMVGEPGEVCIRGPQVMVGYKDRPEETAAALVDGWLRTGDVGTLDEDGDVTVRQIGDAAEYRTRLGRPG